MAPSPFKEEYSRCGNDLRSDQEDNTEKDAEQDSEDDAEQDSEVDDTEQDSEEDDTEQESEQDSEENTEGDTEQMNEDELANFRPLLSHLRIENLAELAISLKTALLGAGDCTDNPLTCTVSPLPLTGSYNILYRVTFSDGSAWIFKIPCIGYLPEWSDTSGRKLRSEANTMKFIRKHTTIPVPEVYAFDSRLDNVITAPYIAMEFIDGINMSRKWYGTADGDELCSRDQLEQRRVKWLKTLAEFFFELGKFGFDKCGMLDFTNGRDDPISIVPLTVYDMEAQHKLRQCTVDPVPPKFCQIGPFLDTKSYLLGLLGLRRFDNSCLNHYRILWHLINWIPESIANAQLGTAGNRFVLCHPDFGVQNIMISNDDECRILSIIDWDGVSTSPLCLGNERYPHWLTRDWDPIMYRYDPKNPNDKQENSPEELERYCDIYATYMQRLVGGEREAFTGFSHVYEALEIAAGNMYSFACIIHLLCEKCIHATRQQGVAEEDDLTLYDVLAAFDEDPPTPMVADRVRDGFLKLCGQGV